MPFIRKSFSIPVRPNSAHRFAPIMPVAASGDKPPAQEPKTVKVESSTGLIFISAAKDIEKAIIIAIVGTEPGPSAARIIENT